MRYRKGVERQAVEEAKQFCEGPREPFREDSEILEAARILFELRGCLQRQFEPDEHIECLALEDEMRKSLHRRIQSTPPNLHLVSTFRRRKLNRIEKEIVLLLTLSALGMCASASDIEEVQEGMYRKGKESLQVVQALAEGSRLETSDLVDVVEEEVPVQSNVTISSSFLTPLLRRKDAESAWKVKNQEELLDRSYGLIQKLGERAEAIHTEFDSDRWQSDDLKGTSRAIGRLAGMLYCTLHLHPDWPLNHLTKDQLCHPSRLIVLALLGKELGFMSPADNLFTGAGLARCVSESVPKVRHNLSLLRKQNSLRKGNYIRISGGYGDASAVEDEATLMTCEFEVTREFLSKVEVKSNRLSKNNARQPQVNPENLVLPSQVRDALDLVVAQMRHSNVLMEKWGMGDVIPYGRAVSVLFSGPPGVGKTATAEAIAHELGKKIMVINYAEIQNCFVGETEKNIVRAFREATEADAVIFWDEADSMFYDRDSAYRNWEVRDINVLLTELERFEGLCVLSTNRKLVLDKALERRIAIKVEFVAPDRDLRKEIWKCLTPTKMPLAKDVDFVTLSREELTGGEIKNVILNAARNALGRNPEGSVEMPDFEKAISMELEGRWSDGIGERIGFLSHPYSA